MAKLKNFFGNLKVSAWIFTTLTLIYFEIITKILTCDVFFNTGLIFMPVFSFCFGLILTIPTVYMSKKTSKIFTGVCLSVIAVIHITQIVYYSVFNKYLVFYSVTAGGVGNVLEGGIITTTLKSILGGIPAMLAFLIPIILVFRFGGKKIIFKRSGWLGLVLALIPAIGLYVGAVAIASTDKDLSTIQSGTFDPNLSVTEFGLIRTELLDIKYNLFGVEQKIEILEENPSDKTEEPSEDEPEVDVSPNVMNIDFAAKNEGETDSAYKTLNEYFATREPTLKNEYTGMYKGYNLVSITAEGFSPYCIDPELTPTLYKMATEGFKFTNFYTPIWGVSTSDGEYVHCTGLIPKSGVWSFYRSGEQKNYMPFCLGNMFKSIGVNKTFAYHNNSHTYYYRNISHPNMGYTFKGYGSGVEEYVTKQWPQSDLEMITGSVKDYLSDGDQFLAYYMTVSGHLEYNFIGNMMSYKNKEAVAHLDCSETLKAYYACNIELDKAMEKLLAELEAAGKLENTVISITPDHYPYGLEQDGADKYSVWREMLGHDVETEFELYKSSFILYCAGTKDAPTIDKYCAEIDILPTILNLFGFEYDSRLLMGNDILSDASDLVIMSNRSFITDRGKYSATAKTFTAFPGKEFATEEEEAEYVKSIRNAINNKFSVSAKILEKDYYGYLFDK